MMKKKSTFPFNQRGIIKGSPVKYSQAHATIGGKRYYFKSKWERNYARYLQWKKEQGDITDWTYETKTFWFEGIKRGTTSYKPDFVVTTLSGIEYHEVKGYMDAKSKTKLKRMAKYFPSERVVLIQKDWFKLNFKFKLVIKDWE
jgi:hypothetical protein